MKLWGGRFETGPSEAFERFSGSLHFDRRLLDADIRGSQAFARALEDIAILTADERGRIFDALVEIRSEPVPLDATDEDIHTFVIRKLKERAGDVADKIHTGRSRNEQVSLDTRLWLRDECDRVDALLRDWLSALLDLAAKYPEAIIPGYTHTRRAQPVLWPHYLLAYFDMFTRDRERFAEARRRIDVLPLGSGALAGSGFPFDRERIARDLEFARVSTNSLDVSADRDFVLDFLYAASTTMLHLSRLCEDWILYSSEEFGWIELGDDVTSGSSLMPQKKNPDSLELIRGKCGSVVAALHALMITMKGLPLTYNRDMQEDKEPLFHAADQLAGSLEMARITAETVALRPEVPLAAAEASWAVATDLAEALARSGVPFHQAHQLVGRLVLAGKKPSEWNAASLAAFSPEFTAEIARFLDPREGMKTRNLVGGTGLQAVAAALAAARESLLATPAMTKSYRQGQILKLIREKHIGTQDELATELRSQGIAATQVTLSRDLRELRLVKTSSGYQELSTAEEQDAAPQLGALVADFLRDARVAQNQVVLKTDPGHASMIAVALDNEDWPEVAGTIAGDDTVLVIAIDKATAETVKARLLAFLE